MLQTKVNASALHEGIERDGYFENRAAPFEVIEETAYPLQRFFLSAKDEFRNVLRHLLHTDGLKEGLVNTAMGDEDRDTIRAIMCGALMGTVYALGAIPA